MQLRPPNSDQPNCADKVSAMAAERKNQEAEQPMNSRPGYPSGLPSDHVNNEEPTQSTNSCAGDLGVKAQTLHKAYCKYGHYFGLKPVVKLPNGRLRWPLHPLRLLKKGVSE